MSAADLRRHASAVATTAAILLLADLFLHWRSTELRVGLVGLHLRDAGSGWTGWGGLAGVLAIALIALLRIPGNGALWAAGGAFASAALAVLGGGSHLDLYGPMMHAHAGATLWPGWLGLVLATLMLAATAARPPASADRGPYRATPHHPA